LIDEIERDGSVFVLSRYGRMVAVLAPLPDRTILEFSGPGWAEETANHEDIEPQPEWLNFDDAQRAILREGAEKYPMPFGLSGLGFDVRRVAIAMVRLELEGLIDRMIGGQKLTRAGVAAARWLDTEDGARSS